MTRISHATVILRSDFTCSKMVNEGICMYCLFVLLSVYVNFGFNEHIFGFCPDGINHFQKEAVLTKIMEIVDFKFAFKP